MSIPEQDQLSPEELSRLLHAAVEPIRPSPEAYQRIRSGVERRGRWRIPAFATGGAVLAGLIVLAVLLLRPESRPHDDIAVPPPITGATGGSASVAGPGGTVTGTGGPGHEPSASGSGPAGVGPSQTATGGSPSTGSTTPSVGPTNQNSQTRPTPTVRPAAPRDVDGDGTVDDVSFTGTDVVVSMSRGGTARQSLPAGSTPTRWIGYDIDQDGFSEVIVRSGASDGVETYTVLRFVVAQTVEIVPNASVPLRSGTSSARTVGYGFKCVNDGVELVAGTSNDGGQTYSVTTTTLRLNLDHWETSGTPTTSAMAAATATPLFTARCGS